MVFSPTTRSRVLIATAIVVTSMPSASGHAAEVPLHSLIDQRIDASLTKQKLTAAAPASDAEFMRRVYLDLTGTIPDSKTARAFIEDADVQKRTKLIDQLLASENYATHMATVFDVMLMERRPDKYVTTPEWRTFLAESFGANKPLNVLVAEILGADGVDEKLRPAARFYLDRAVAKDLLVETSAVCFWASTCNVRSVAITRKSTTTAKKHYHCLSVFVAGSKTFKQPDNGTEIVDRPVHVGEMFHPYLQAVGLDSTGTHVVGGNSVPIGPPERSAVKELLI